MNLKDTVYGNLTGKTHTGDISIPYNATSLKGVPEVVDGSFYMNACLKIKSLMYAPREVKGDLKCNWSKIKSLSHAPRIVEGDFKINYSHRIENLKGAPDVVGGDFYCNNCNKLESLEGAPRVVKGVFNCNNCPKLKTLDHLLKCDVKTVNAPKRLLEDYNKKKAAVDKHGYDKAMEIFNMMEEIL